MRTRLWLIAGILVVVGALVAGAPVARAAEMGNTPPVTVPRFARFEASFTLPGTTGNPFDPVENDVWVSFLGPRNVVRVPAFWDGVWKVRFAPVDPGLYTLFITRNGLHEIPADLNPSAFVCTASSRPGFIRRDPLHTQRFLFDSGHPYYPLGINQAWTTGGLPDYPGMFKEMHDHSMNWARVWMTFWDGKALDWAPNQRDSPPPGQLLLSAARRMDMVMDAADQDGVYVQLVLQHHGQLTRTVDPNWSASPLNAANPGGYLKEPLDFFTDPKAIRLTKAKYRYIVARYGYSDHLLGWELFNEIQNNPEVRGHMDAVIAWHRRMADYLRSIDVNRHLITTSYTPAGDPLEAGSNIDYDQAHAYVPDIVAFLRSQDIKQYTRPIFWGEWGASGRSQTEAFLHDGLWCSLMTLTAGAAQFWYWDDVERRGWWPQFASAAAYVDASGFPWRPDVARVQPRIATESRGDLTFAPGKGWAATTGYEVEISPETGAMKGLSEVSSFVQGKAHRDMTEKPVQFTVDFPQPGRFDLTVATSARSGSHPQLLLDGVVGAEKDLPAADRDTPVNETLSLTVPVGKHVIGLFNTGPDWFTVGRIVLQGYAPAVDVIAKASPDAVFFWAYRRPGTGAAAVSATLAFDGMQDGRYRVQLWDTAAGRTAGASRIRTAHHGTLEIPLSGLSHDIAGWAIR